MISQSVIRRGANLTPFVPLSSVEMGIGAKFFHINRNNISNIFSDIIRKIRFI